jgi:sucrose-phosphate synthase
MRSAGIPPPDVLITAVGTEIYYAPEMNPDDAWTRHIDHLWTPRTVREVLAEVPGLQLHPKSELTRFKLGYYYDPHVAPSPEELSSLLLRADQTVNLTVSHDRFVDIVPVRASKGAALRWFSEQWGVPIDRILCAGGGGTDEDLLRGNTLAVVVANRRDEELSELTDPSRIYFAERPYAGGLLEAIEYYDLYGACRMPEAA